MGAAISTMLLIGTIQNCSQYNDDNDDENWFEPKNEFEKILLKYQKTLYKAIDEVKERIYEESVGINDSIEELLEHYRYAILENDAISFKLVLSEFEELKKKDDIYNNEDFDNLLDCEMTEIIQYVESLPVYSRSLNDSTNKKDKRYFLEKFANLVKSFVANRVEMMRFFSDQLLYGNETK